MSFIDVPWIWTKPYCISIAQHFFSAMLSVLNLIWAVYVGSWSLKKDGAFLCLYSVSFSIVLLLCKKWITMIVLIDHYVISYLISILIFLDIFWSHCHLIQMICSQISLSSCYRHWKIFISYMGIFSGKRFEINYWLGSFPNEILLFYLDILKASVKHIILRYWKCCTPQ